MTRERRDKSSMKRDFIEIFVYLVYTRYISIDCFFRRVETRVNRIFFRIFFDEEEIERRRLRKIGYMLKRVSENSSAAETFVSIFRILGSISRKGSIELYIYIHLLEFLRYDTIFGNTWSHLESSRSKFF